MSRERKFRAWSNEHNRYCDFITLDEKGRWIGWIKSSGVYLTTADIILEQYTGLKDKNGKEIYKGDIVLDYYDGDDAFIVEWDKDTASFILTGTDNIASVSFDSFYSDKDLEVIGNIHENPELLEKGGEK